MDYPPPKRAALAGIGASSLPRVLALALIPILAGCAVPVQRQRLVSKPNMLFSRSAVYSYSSRVMSQLQPGLAVSGGAQASACTVCQ